MRVVAATLYDISWSIDGRGAARGLISREGLVCRGEASPLPSTSRETLCDVRVELMSVPPTTSHPPNDERIYGIYSAAPGVVSAVDGAA